MPLGSLDVFVQISSYLVIRNGRRVCLPTSLAPDQCPIFSLKTNKKITAILIKERSSLVLF